MKFRFNIAGLLLFAGVNIFGQKTFTNPLNVKFGDPFILKTSSGKYYMYGTGGVKDGFRCCSSDDLVNWKEEGQVFSGNSDSSWCISNFWAPEVYDQNGKFYMFYSADWRNNPSKELENFKIGVAVSDKPTGPFKNLFNKPIFDPGYPIIDADLLFDSTGRVFLYYSRCCYKHPVESEFATWAKNKGLFKEIEESWVYGVELKPDFSGIIGEPVLLLYPPKELSDKQSEWESRSVTAGEVNRRWTEGSCIFKRNSKYYMMYSANYFGGEYYAVGYAVADNPLGPFKKALNNPVLQRNTKEGGIVTGTGHCNVVMSPDGEDLYCVYHGRTKKTGNDRVVFIDKIKFDKDGELIVTGPSTTAQPWPK